MIWTILFAICVITILVMFIFVMGLFAWDMFEETEVGQMWIERMKEKKKNETRADD